MCGIFGYTGKEIPGLLDQMLVRIRHRGPDDQGFYSDPKVSMGMARLAVIDLTGGRQPMANEDERIWVIFNGEIFNFVELRQELEARGHRLRTRSDTETIVHAYEEYGQALAHHLNGMFAIALWDSTRETLLLVRDRYGVKPLFYAELGEALVFGSEIKAVLCHPRTEREIDDEALSQFLSLRYVPSPLTIYRGVQSLPPGHLLVWDGHESRIRRWYQLPMTVRWKEEDEEGLVERIDTILRDAVRIRLRSDVQYGAYLSGGIDSGTVVALMSELSRAPVKTFCLTYADSPEHKQDAHYARMVAKRYGTDHHEYVMNWRELHEEINEVLRHLDQPFSGVISSFWLSRFIKKHVTVALSGDGADDTFGSYGHHRLVWPIREVLEAREKGRSPEQVDFGFFKNREEWVLELARKKPWEWRLAYAAFTEDEKEELFSEKGEERFGRYSTSDFLKRIYEMSPPEGDDLNRMLYLDIQTLLPNEILYYNDMLSMAHAVEVRTPFLDYRLVELANSIPGTLKIRKGILKYILRRVAARYLPKEILERPKEGFVLPKNTWFRTEPASLPNEVLSPQRLNLHGYFEIRFVKNLLERFMAGDDSLTFKVWTLMVFQWWYENWLEDKKSSRVSASSPSFLL